MMRLISVVIFVVLLYISWQLTSLSMSTNGTVVCDMDSFGINGNKPGVAKLTSKQTDMLKFAYDIAKNDGIKQPKYLQAILMKESTGCIDKRYRVSGLSNKPSDRYFGCGQIKLKTALGVMKAFPTLWDYTQTKTEEEVQALLILDDLFNIRIASKLLYMLGVNDNPTFAITAYNLGEVGATKVVIEEHEYTQDVLNRI